MTPLRIGIDLNTRMTPALAVAMVLLVPLAPPHRLDCAAEPRACEHAIVWQRAKRLHAERELRRERAERWRLASPTLREAAAVAEVVYGVPAGELLRVARCESTSTGSERYVWHRNAATATGAFQWLDSTWQHSRWAAFDRGNVWIETLATAWLVQRDHGWREWSCGWAA